MELMHFALFQLRKSFREDLDAKRCFSTSATQKMVDQLTQMIGEL